MSTFADRLKELRSSANLTQEELSERLGVSRSTLASWETGRRIPDTMQVAEIARFFNTSMDFLMGLIDNPERKAGFLKFKSLGESAARGEIRLGLTGPPSEMQELMQELATVEMFKSFSDALDFTSRFDRTVNSSAALVEAVEEMEGPAAPLALAFVRLMHAYAKGLGLGLSTKLHITADKAEGLSAEEREILRRYGDFLSEKYRLELIDEFGRPKQASSNPDAGENEGGAS